MKKLLKISVSLKLSLKTYHRKLFKVKLPAITDLMSAPSCPFYKVQPENQGILLFISGVSGTGKSTTAQILAREFG